MTSISIIDQCEQNKECTIDCESQSCDNAYINGSNANKLTVNCYHCSQSILLCPKAGCIINGNQEFGITNSKIYYNGTQTDNGVLAVNCYHNYACSGIKVYASNVSRLIMTASDPSPIKASGAIVYAEFANNITIECGGGHFVYSAASNIQGPNGFRNTYIYANYSNYINVTAISPWGFRDSYLYAQYAESVNIYATGNGMFHIFEDLSGVYLL